MMHFCKLNYETVQTLSKIAPVKYYINVSAVIIMQ